MDWASIILDIGDRRLVGHCGGFPGFITLTMFDPKDRLAIVVLTNDVSAAADRLARHRAHYRSGAAQGERGHQAVRLIGARGSPAVSLT